MNNNPTTLTDCNICCKSQSLSYRPQLGIIFVMIRCFVSYSFSTSSAEKYRAAEMIATGTPFSL